MPSNQTITRTIQPEPSADAVDPWARVLEPHLVGLPSAWHATGVSACDADEDYSYPVRMASRQIQ